MSLQSRPLTGLYNGVSQQPATLRMDSQLEAQVNIYGSVTDGLLKRPPLTNVALIQAGTLAGTAFFHTINRSIAERYSVVITNGNVQVFAQDGTEKTVTKPQGVAYLASTDPGTEFAVVTIADYSFIVNKSITVATEVADSTEPVALADWYTPTTWFRDGTVPPESYFNVAQGTYKGSKNSFEALPAPSDTSPPVEGDVWRVKPSNTGTDSGTDVYYVVRRSGVWEETYAPIGGSIQLDDATMPHALVREADGNFTFQPFAWKARQVGDDITNPAPSFVGSKIRDAFYYKNRLGFVSNESVIFSGAGDFGGFFRLTVMDLLDSAPVDVTISGTNVSVLEYAVPFANSLMLFAEQAQAVLNVDEVLTPRTVSVDLVTSYEMSTRVRPVPLGNDVYFPSENGSYSRIREYFVESGQNQSDAADVTAHVPKYVPSDIIAMAGNTNEDVLFIASSAAGYENRIYVYKFYWVGDEKVQSSWSYFELDAASEILSMSVLESDLLVLIQRADGVYLESMNLQAGDTATGVDFQVYLDRRTEILGVWGTGVTTWTLPYPVPAGTERDNFKLVRGAAFTAEVGSLVDPSTYTWVNSTTITTPNQDDDGTVFAGVAYDSSFTFSEQFVKSQDQSITTGRLMLRTFTVYYTNTAYFATDVAPYGNGDNLVEEIIPSSLSAFTGKTLGAASLLIGEPSFHTGSYSFQVYGDSRNAVVSISTDSHVGMNINSCEWEGFYFNRAAT